MALVPEGGTQLGYAQRVAAAAAEAREEAAKGPEAGLEAWLRVKNQFPSEPPAYAEVISLLGRLHREEEAEKLAAEALKRFPRSSRVAAEFGWLAHHRGDWPEADRRWQIMRDIFPDAFEGYFGGGATLRALGRYAEAEPVYARAVERWPQHFALYESYAACAEEAGALEEAQSRYAELDRRFLAQPEGMLGVARVLGSLGEAAASERHYAATLERFPGNPTALIAHAHAVDQWQEPDTAIARWTVALAAAPDYAEGYAAMAHALDALGRYEEAEAAAGRARALKPTLADAGWLWARIAHNRGAFELACERWIEFRANFPDQLTGYSTAVWSLVALSRQEEAAALMDEGIARFPDELEVALDWGRIPHHVEDWREAERRWARLLPQFPHSGELVAEYAEVLARLAKWDEAEALIANASTDNPRNFSILNVAALCASRHHQWELAEARWHAVHEVFPDNPVGWAGYADMLRDSGRLGEAEALLASRIAAFGEGRDLKLQLALTVSAQRDWPRALRLWSELKRDLPYDSDVQFGIVEALAQARLDAGAMIHDGRIPFTIPPMLEDDSEEGLSIRALLMKFEALGGTCEFGMVQRRFGAEPISLMRWASTDPPELLRALDTQFEGVGEEEFTRVVINGEEYATRDERYFMFTHTFVRTTLSTIEEFTAQHLKRMQFLKRKLLLDLARSNKIFICASAEYTPGDAQLDALYASFRRYGTSAAMLCIREAEEDHLAGSVERRERGYYIGYIDRFSTRDISYGCWIELCRNADQLWTAEPAP